MLEDSEDIINTVQNAKKPHLTGLENTAIPPFKIKITEIPQQKIVQYCKPHVLLISTCNPSNAKMTVFAELSYLALCSHVHVWPKKLHIVKSADDGLQKCVKLFLIFVIECSENLFWHRWIHVSHFGQVSYNSIKSTYPINLLEARESMQKWSLSFWLLKFCKLITSRRRSCHYSHTTDQ